MFALFFELHWFSAVTSRGSAWCNLSELSSFWNHWVDRCDVSCDFEEPCVIRRYYGYRRLLITTEQTWESYALPSCLKKQSKAAGWWSAYNIVGSWTLEEGNSHLWFLREFWDDCPHPFLLWYSFFFSFGILIKKCMTLWNHFSFS